MRPLLYRLWRHVPTWLQNVLMYLGSPKVALGAAALVVDDRGRVLLLRHTYRVPAWGLPAGLVRRGEAPARAIARELREELGVDPHVGALVQAERDARWRLTLVYRVTFDGRPRHGIETDAHRFVSCDDMRAFTGKPAPAWMRARANDHVTDVAVPADSPNGPGIEDIGPGGLA